MQIGKAAPEQTRAEDVDFVKQCNLLSLQKQLPLLWPTPARLPPSPKKSYRSEYVYPWIEALADPDQVLGWNKLSDFDLALRLVDFSGLRPVLAHLLGWKTGRGWEPFDPVSFFLLSAWQTANRWGRNQCLKNLADQRYADYAIWFGFRNGVHPTEGGLRWFLTRLGDNSDASPTCVSVEQGQEVIQVAVQKLNHLLVGALGVMCQVPVFSPTSWTEALLCPDGQIHDAASRLRCISVTENCYKACTPENPRPCPAKGKDRRGCDCDSLACAQVCAHATPRDPQARYIWYSGSNQDLNSPNHSICAESAEHTKGKARYGYRSLPLRLVDQYRRFSVTLLDDVRPANGHEDVASAALLVQLRNDYPDLKVDAVAGDAGFGFEVYLHTVFDTLQARRVIDRRSHQTDRDKTQWPTRGYDDHGRPVCNYGYSLNSYGFDRLRRRHKWACDQTCLHGKDPQVKIAQVAYPPQECPYLANAPHGRVINVGERFADASIRLVRDVPMGSSVWKAIYPRARNAVEGRNATFEDWGFKRMHVFGLARSKTLLFFADVLDTLSTLARLVREATLASVAT